MPKRTAVALFAWLVAILPLAGCGGGGGGGGSAPAAGGSQAPGQPNDPNDFFLKSVSIARPIFAVDGGLDGLVNPASLHEVDPITGVVVPGFPKPLQPGIVLATLAVVDLPQILDPFTPQIPLVPRNAAIVLEMSKPVQAATLNLSDADPENPGLVTGNTPVQVLDKAGTPKTARIHVQGNRIVLHGVTSLAPGWEASPLVFDSFGKAVEDPLGHLRIVLGIGAGALAATDGSPLVPRTDGLGTLGKPLPFNPGNSKLDAIVQQTEAGVVGFNGFLPDLSPPRIVRPVELSGSIDAVDLNAGALVGTALAIPTVAAANGGLGEWAGAVIDVTGLGGVKSSYVVASSGNQALSKPVFTLEAGSVIDPSVIPGIATYTVRRSEFFEPIPPPLPANAAALAHITVDPVAHPRDPFDPQDLINHDLRYFVRVFDPAGVERTAQWNPAENLFGPVKGKFDPIPHKSSLRMQFSEPMDAASFRPYESFLVTDLSAEDTDPAFGRQRIGRAVASADGRMVSFEPFLDSQFASGTPEFIGFGGTGSSLKLVLRSLPSVDDVAAIESSVTASQLAKLVDLDAKGVFGITDRGGRGLGLPPALIDQSDPVHFLLQSTSAGQGAFPPAIDFSVAFQTVPSADPDYGAIVHRFQGQASTANFTYPTGSVHDTVTTGIEYADFPPADENNDTVIDHRFIYGPNVFDAGLNLPGRLTGAPVSIIEHLIDDFVAPKPSNFSSPNGEDIMYKLGFGSTLPLNSPFGCRMQMIYRSGDASPAHFDYEGVVLDLIGMSWAPNGSVIPQTIDDFELLVGLSGVNKGRGPSTKQGAGIPDAPGSGLRDQFDCNVLENELFCSPATEFAPTIAPYASSQPKLTPVIASGSPYVIAPGNIKNPAFVGSATFNPATPGWRRYVDYPAFNAGVDPYFGKTNVFSFPYDSRFAMLVEFRLNPLSPENFPSAFNVYRFSPGIQTSVLPRFRVWSQGQHPLANCVPNTFLGSIVAGGGVGFTCGFKGGEGGPLLRPGSPLWSAGAPAGINGMPAIPKPGATGYIALPAVQPQPDSVNGNLMNGVLPKCNTDPDMNYYFANGMLAYPLPLTAIWPGPSAPVPSTYLGYGAAGTGIGTLLGNEPNYQCDPGDYGDNSRYFTMWQYRKRISIIESPTVRASAPSGLVQFLPPLIDPPLSTVDPAAGVKLELRTSTQLDFAVAVLESGYVDVNDAALVSKLLGQQQLGDLLFIKFRATFAAANGQSQPPSIDTIVLPFRKLP